MKHGIRSELKEAASFPQHFTRMSEEDSKHELIILKLFIGPGLFISFIFAYA
jgi:hypothetical protein